MCRTLGLGVVAALLATAGCGGSSTIDCTKNTDCTQGGIPGVCLPSPSSSTMWCAFTDTTCPSGQRWGAAAGDDLARTCVAEGVVDGGVDAAVVDAGPDATHEPDAGPPPVLSSKIFVLGVGGSSLFVFDAATLAPLGTSTLPVSSPSGLDVAEDTLWVLGGTVIGGTAGQSLLTALDPRTLLLKPGYPKKMAGADCSTSNGFVTKDGLYCASGGASTETDDVVHLMAPPDFTISKSSPNTPSIFKVGGTDGLILASYGGTIDKTVGVYGPNLDALTGSPVTSPTTHAVTLFAANKGLKRFAIASAAQAVLYDTDTMTQVGTMADFGSSEQINGMAFDEKHAQLILVFNSGKVTSRSISDFSVKVPIVALGAGPGVIRPFVDLTRDRVYVADSSAIPNHLYVLDSATLALIGTPVVLPGSAQDVASF